MITSCSTLSTQNAHSVSSLSDRFSLLSLSKRTSTTLKASRARQNATAVISIVSGFNLPTSLGKLICQYADIGNDRLSIIADDTSCILYDFPSGAPNVEEPCDKETLQCDTRTRVHQKAPEGNDGVYSTLQTLWKPIGKNPSNELLHDKAIETLCDSTQEKLIKHLASLPAAADQLAVLEPLLRSWKNNSQTKHYWDTNGKYEYDNERMREGSPALDPFMQEFFQQKKFDNVHEFLVHKRMSPRAEIAHTFLHAVGRTFSNMFQQSYKINVRNISSHLPQGTTPENPLSQYATAIQRALLENYYYTTLAEIHGLKPATWTPWQNIHALISQIKTVGPLVIAGFYHRGHYFKDAYPIRNVKGRTIYGWNSKDRIPGAQNSRLVTIVGASNYNTEELVYYINCHDESPTNTPRKIYVMSYKTMKTAIFAINAIWQPDEVPSPEGYAWCAEKFEIID